MKRLLVFFLMLASPGFAQLALVEDVDGFVNIRSEKSKTAAVSDTLHSGQLVCMTDTSADWIWIMHGYTGKSGYVHRSRLKPVHQMPADEQRKMLVRIFNKFVAYKWKIRHGNIAQTDRSGISDELMEAALGSMVLSWPMNPDTITLHAAFKALAASGGSASEQRLWLAARCAAQTPYLFKYILCHEEDVVRSEVMFTTTTGLVMNTVQDEVKEPYPAFHFTQREATYVLEKLKQPCPFAFRNFDDTVAVASEQQRAEYMAIVFAESDMGNTNTIASTRLEKGGRLTVSGDTGTISAFGYTFILTDKSFVPSAHVLFYSKGPRPMLEAIDAALFWGTDGDLPERELAQLGVSYKGVTHSYSAGVVQGLYQPNHKAVPTSEFQHVQVYRSADKRRVYLRMYGGDGAGGYLCVWQFSDGVYKGRVVDHGF